MSFHRRAAPNAPPDCADRRRRQCRPVNEAVVRVFGSGLLTYTTSLLRHDILVPQHPRDMILHAVRIGFVLPIVFGMR